MGFDSINESSNTIRAVKEVEDILKVIKESEDDAAVVSTVLDAVSEVVDRDILRKTAIGWFDEKGIDDDVGAKFGSGIANTAPATPEMMTKVLFYSEEYRPPIPDCELYSNLGTWFTPSGYLWNSDTVDDLKGNGDLILKHHHNNHPEVVIPFYLYSASQKGKRHVWAVWSAPKDPTPDSPGCWRKVTNSDLESIFQESVDFDCDPTWFPKRLGLRKSCIPSCKLMMSLYQNVVGFDLYFTFIGNFVLIRYSVTERGNPRSSPLHDTIAWLPNPDLEAQDFSPPLNMIPSSGIVEYLSSRDPSETIDWTKEEGGWTASFALGPSARILISKCFAEDNQQDYNPELHAEVITLIKGFIGEELEAYAVLTNTLASWALTNSCGCGGNDNVDIPSDEIISNLKPLLQNIIKTKLRGNESPPPATLAHILEIQCLQYSDSRISFVALSGSNPVVTSFGEKPIPVLLTRITDTYDDQIFWQLNRAMRMKQWETKPHLQVDASLGEQNGGSYYLPSDNGIPEVYEQVKNMELVNKSGSTARMDVASGRWLINEVPHQQRHFWMELGTWLCNQMLPLQYYIDVALVKANDIRGSKAPLGLCNYRGLKGVTLDRNLYGTGKVVLWSAYSSASGDRGIATAFATGDDKAAIFSLVGRACVCISKWSRYGREREWLYPPNSIFQVTGSLSEEHAELAGKKNLQIFSMSEVDDIDALLAYLRGLVNQVVANSKSASKEEARAMPVHVEALFQVMLQLVDYRTRNDIKDINRSLEFTCDPRAPILYTEEGAGLARKLLDMGASQSVLSHIGHQIVGPNPRILLLLVKAGAPFEGDSGVVSWMIEFESNYRKWLLKAESLQRVAIKRLKVFDADEHTTRDSLTSACRDFIRSHNVTAVRISNLSGCHNYFNGLYLKQSGELLFKQVNGIRFGTFCEIKFETGTANNNGWSLGEWCLSDCEIRLNITQKIELEWLARSCCLEGMWQTIVGLKHERQRPFATLLHDNPQMVGSSKNEFREKEKTEFERLEQELTSLDDADEKCVFESDVKKLRNSHCCKLISVPITKGICDPNILPVPSSWEGVTREKNVRKAFSWQTSQMKCAGHGFDDLYRDSSNDYRNKSNPPVRIDRSLSLRKYLDTGSGFGTGKYHHSRDPCWTGSADRRKEIPLAKALKLQRKLAKLHCVSLTTNWVNNMCNAACELNDLAAAKPEEDQRREAKTKVLYYEWKRLRRKANQLEIDLNEFPHCDDCSVDERTSDINKLNTTIELKLDQMKQLLGDDIPWNTRVIHFPNTIEGLNSRTILATPIWKPKPKPPPDEMNNEKKESFIGIPNNTPLGGSRGILNIHIGQAGCQIGSALWELFCIDHGIDDQGRRRRFSIEETNSHAMGNPSVLFDERQNGFWRPRAVFIDMDPGVIEQSHISHNLSGVMLKQNNVEGMEDCADLWSVGYYQNKEYHRLAFDKIRKLGEACDVVQGLQVTHSMSGGCGSGFGSAIYNYLGKEWSRKPIHSHVLVPSPKVQDSTCSAYNFMLSLKPVTENVSFCSLYDNESLYHACYVSMGVTNPSYRDLNDVFAQNVAAVTGSLRLPNNLSLRSMAHVGQNLCPYPSLLLALPSFAPLCSRLTDWGVPQSGFKALSEMASSVLHPNNSLCSVDPFGRKVMSMCANFRGDSILPVDALAVAEGVRTSRHVKVTDFTPCPLKIAITRKVAIAPPTSYFVRRNLDNNIAMLTNSSACGTLLKRILSRAKILWSKRAFVHWYVSHGMEEAEFPDSTEHSTSLQRDYEEVDWDGGDDCE